jgi:hypothetical protein
MSLQWSPGDLDRQREIVGLALERADSHRERLWVARRAFAGRLRAAAVPVAVSAAAVAAAFALGRYFAPRRASRRHEPVAVRVEHPGGGTGVQSVVGLALALAQTYLRVRKLVAPAESPPPARVR